MRKSTSSAQQEQSRPQPSPPTPRSLSLRSVSFPKALIRSLTAKLQPSLTLLSVVVSSIRRLLMPRLRRSVKERRAAPSLTYVASCQASQLPRQPLQQCQTPLQEAPMSKRRLRSAQKPFLVKLHKIPQLMRQLMFGRVLIKRSAWANYHHSLSKSDAPYPKMKSNLAQLKAW